MQLIEYIIVLIALTGLASGLFTLHVNRIFFRSFTSEDLVNGRVDSWLYVANVLSTACCAIELFIRGWLMYGQMPDNICRVWFTSALILHLLVGTLSIVLHITTHRLLSKPEFCELCKLTK